MTGGLGVVEAGLIAGLASAGVPEDQAVAVVLIQRFFAAYLPPGLVLAEPGVDALPRISMSVFCCRGRSARPGSLYWREW